MTKETMIILIVMLITKTMSSCISKLKTISLINGNNFEKYGYNFLDSLTYAIFLKTMVSDNSLYGLIPYISGDMIGLWLSDIINERLNKKIYLINLYIEDNFIDIINNYLISNNISYNLIQSFFKEKERSYFKIHLNEFQKNNLIVFLKDIGIENPTYDLSEIKVHGKIKKRI